MLLKATPLLSYEDCTAAAALTRTSISVHLFLVCQRELELIAEALRIPGSKSLGPVAKVGRQGGTQGGLTTIPQHGADPDGAHMLQLSVRAVAVTCQQEQPAHAAGQYTLGCSLVVAF
jgi:hypothetical protein